MIAEICNFFQRGSNGFEFLILNNLSKFLFRNFDFNNRSEPIFCYFVDMKRELCRFADVK